MAAQRYTNVSAHAHVFVLHSVCTLAVAFLLKSLHILFTARDKEH